MAHQWLNQKSDGLSALVKIKLEQDSLSGQLFVVIHRKGNPCKSSALIEGGCCLWSTQLEQEQFHTRAGDAIKRTLLLTDLKLIIEGINTRLVREHKRYSKSSGENHKTPENRLQ